MSQTKYLKGECSHCGGRMEFPAESIGAFADCPHCGQSTELTLALPAQPSTVPVKALVWSLIAVLILGGGLAGAMIALKRAQGMAARQKTTTSESAPPAESLSEAHALAEQAELSVSAIVLEKAPGSALVHAVGTVHNTAARQRFGVKIELDLFDAAGQRLGTAQDYQPVMEPNSQWRFKALVIHSKVTIAKLASIKEAQ
jgi:hypothetical protein